MREPCSKRDQVWSSLGKSEKGMSLLTVVIALGIMGITAASLSKMMGNQYKATADISLQIDKQSLKRMLLRTSCAESLPSGSCSAGDLMEVKMIRNGSPQVVISANPTTPSRIGRFALKAQCNSTGDGIDIRVATLKPGKTLTTTNPNDFIASPLTKRVHTWESQSSLLFPAGAGLCVGSGTTPVTIEPPASFSQYTNTTNVIGGSTVIKTYRNGSSYIRTFDNLREVPGGVKVCCDYGSTAISMGGKMLSGYDSAITSRREEGVRCINFCEGECNNEVWGSVWLSCVGL